MRAYLCAALIGAASSLISCADLTSIDRGTCGNSIVEFEAGEDCDSFPADLCHPPGSKFACRFACDASTRQGCPEGWGCGSDGVCRQPTSAFAASSRPSPRPAARLFSADFDGDGFLDVAGLGPDELRIHYFDQADPFGSELSIRPAAIPAIGDLTPSDPASDLVMISSGTFGVSVLHGRSDRSLLALPYSYLSVPDMPLTLISMEVMPDDMATMEWVGEEALLVLGKTIAITAGEAKGGDVPVFSLPHDISQTAGPLQVADISDDPVASPCEEIAVTWKGANDVTVLTPCKCTNCPVQPGTAPTYALSGKDALVASVALPPGVTASTGALTAHLNRDEHIDLLLAQGTSLYVAYGLGDGRFASSREMIAGEAKQHDNQFGKVTMFSGGEQWPAQATFQVLAAGLAEGDDYPELVISAFWGAALLSTGPGSKSDLWDYAPMTSASSELSGAAFGDFNRNGRPDVVYWSEKARDIHFLSGAEGGYFNEFVLRTEGIPALVRVADVDGDSVDDVVYVDRVPELDDSFSVMFGRAFGVPEEPVQIARFPLIDDLVPTHTPMMTLDRAEDMIVLTKDLEGTRGVSIFQGSTNRQVQSPLWLFSDKIPDGLPMIAAVGDFAADPDHRLDFMAITAQLTDTAQALSVERLWLVPVQGDAHVDPNQLVFGDPLPPTFRAESALMTAVDLDGSGSTQELVMLARNLPLAGSNLGSMIVARVKESNGTRTIELGAPQETPEAWAVPDSLLPYAGASTDRAIGGSIRAVDIDADGRVEVAALGQALVGEKPDNVLVIFPNTGSGTLVASDAVRVPNNTGDILRGFAFVQADLDEPLELVLLGREQSWIVQVDLPARSFSAPVPLDGVGGGVDAIGGDFDRDGIHDLVIVGQDGLRYHKGMAVLP